MASTPSNLVTVVVAALVGGVAGGAVATFAGGPSGKEKENDARGEASKDERRRSVERADEEPEDGNPDRISRVEKRLRVLERRSAAATELRRYAETLAADDGDGGAPKAPSATVDADDPVFELAVRSVVDRWDEDRRENQRSEWRERGQRMQARQVDNLQRKLTLTDDQKEKIAAIVRAYSERSRGLWEADAGRPVTPAEWREATEKIRSESEGELKGVLDVEQQRAYEALVEEGDTPFARWGGGGR